MIHLLDCATSNLMAFFVAVQAPFQEKGSLDSMEYCGQCFLLANVKLRAKTLSLGPDSSE